MRDEQDLREAYRDAEDLLSEFDYEKDAELRKALAEDIFIRNYYQRLRTKEDEGEAFGNGFRRALGLQKGEF